MGIPEGQPGPELGGPMEFHGHLKSWIHFHPLPFCR